MLTFTHESVDATLDSAKRLLIVSCVRLLRDGLLAILEQRPGVQAVQAVASVGHALVALESFRPTLILLDVSNEDGLHAAHQLAESARETPMLGFAARADDHDVLAYAKTGISAFVSREASLEDLFDAIERAAQGEFLCPPRVAATLFRQLAALAGVSALSNSDTAPLTAREIEIARCIERGLSNKQIARHLSIEVSTVKNHVHNILEKLHVASRGEAAAKVRGSSGARMV